MHTILSRHYKRSKLELNKATLNSEYHLTALTAVYLSVNAHIIMLITLMYL